MIENINVPSGKNIVEKKYSVLMTVYKKDVLNQFVKALDSIISQTQYPNEIILVADGPISLEIEKEIKKYQESHEIIKFYKIKKNIGLGNALNFGLFKTNYDYVMRMDSDDYSDPQRAAKLIDELSKNSVSVVGSYVAEFVNEPQLAKVFIKYPLRMCGIKLYHYFRDPIGHASVMFKKKNVIESGGYLDCNLFEDTYLWLRMAKKGFSFKSIQENLYFARTGNDFIDRRGGLKYLSLEIGHFFKFYKEELISVWSLLLNLSFRPLIRLLPKKILKIIYLYALRKKLINLN
tara:strand:- start:282 stop:1154 length:873 start_codon:yes stop_codon:yes gene_type:complete